MLLVQKMNVIALLEFELVLFEAAIQYFIHYVKPTAFLQ